MVVVVEMCLDCAWLWQAFSRPIPPALQSSPTGQSRSYITTDADLASKNATEASSSVILESLPSEGVNDVTSGDAVVELLHRLGSSEVDEQRALAKELRILAKESPEKKILIARAGSIPLIVKLLAARDPETQEHAVTILLNLSIINANKVAIVRAGAVNAIVEVLKSGSMEARENAAATLFSLSVLDENKVMIGKSRAFPPLVDLLKDGTMRGRNDAASALFNLSLYDQNRLKAVSAGVLPPLIELVGDSATDMVDVALAILSLIAAHKDCRMFLTEASVVPALIEVIKSGSPGNKEIAIAILLALSEDDPSQVNLAKKLGATSPVAEVAKSGIPRARRKASRLAELLNSD